MRAAVLSLVLLTSSAALATPSRARADARVVADAIAIGMATRALDENKPAEALEQLARVDQGSRFVVARLEGLAHAALGDHQRAARALSRAQTIHALDERTEIALATSAHAAGDCTLALASLARLLVVDDADLTFAKAQCEAKKGQSAAAIATLDASLAPLLPDAHALRARLFADAGMVDVARPDAEIAARTMHSADAVYDLAKRIGALGIAVAEIGVVRFPDDARFPALLARLHERSAPRRAARAAARAALLEPSASKDAAELMRATGDIARALRENARVTDPQARIRQRLALLIDAQAWDRACSLAPRLASAGLLDDDAVAYALAYAYFRTERDAEAGALLDGIEDAVWFERATALRGAIASCGEEGGRCAR